MASRAPREIPLMSAHMAVLTRNPSRAKPSTNFTVLCSSIPASTRSLKFSQLAEIPMEPSLTSRKKSLFSSGEAISKNRSTQ